jgi:hypothetical protein
MLAKVGILQLTWLSAARLQLCKLINDILQFLRIAASDCPFKILRQVCSHPFRHQFTSIASRAQKDEFVLS